MILNKKAKQRAAEQLKLKIAKELRQIERGVRYQFGMYLFNIPVHAIFLTVAFDDDKYDAH